MADRVDITQAVASQRIYFYPQECPDPAGRGRPTATPSVLIKDQYGTTVTAAATTYVTQDPVNTTINGTSAAGDSTLTLTSVANVEVGVTYLATSTLGQAEWVRVRGIDSSGVVVHLDEPLEYAYVATDTFVGTRFYHTLQTAEVDTLEELYRARATYAVGGRNFTLEAGFDVVLTPLLNPLTPGFLKLRLPDIMAQEHAETRGSDYLDLRTAAWDRVRKGIRDSAHGRRPALLRTPDDAEEWGWAEFMLLAYNAGVDVLRGDWGAEEAIEHLEGRIERTKRVALSTMEFYDDNEDDSRSDDDTRPLTLDLIR